MGYVLGKAEGEGTLWHGHVSAVTVAPMYRRLGLAKTLMQYFEDVSIHTYNAYFVDLFVRASNHLAINMYSKFGYSTYRRVLGYYSGELPEDALDMRKALPRYVMHGIGLYRSCEPDYVLVMTYNITITPRISFLMIAEMSIRIALYLWIIQ